MKTGVHSCLVGSELFLCHGRASKDRPIALGRRDMTLILHRYARLEVRRDNKHSCGQQTVLRLVRPGHGTAAEQITLSCGRHRLSRAIRIMARAR
jgi:hypothetical protein